MMTPRLFVDLCEDAYDDDKITFRKDGTEVLVRNTPEGQVYAFRGTSFDMGDILSDMRAVPWWDSQLGWCHKGFLRGAQGVWPWFLNGDEPRYLTGHSKGGAEAVLVAAMLAFSGLPAAGLVTFGAPAPSYGGHVKKLLKDTPQQRYVNAVDCIPSHPILGSHPSPRVQLRDWSLDDRFLHPTLRFTDHKIAEYDVALGGWLHPHDR